MLQLGDEFFRLRLRLAELGVLQQLVRLPHLFEDQLLSGEFQGQPEPGCVLRLQARERLGEPEHAFLQLGHLRGDVLLGEADRIAVGDGRLRGAGRLRLARLLLLVLIVVEDVGGFGRRLALLARAVDGITIATMAMKRKTMRPTEHRWSISPPDPDSQGGEKAIASLLPIVKVRPGRWSLAQADAGAQPGKKRLEGLPSKCSCVRDSRTDSAASRSFRPILLTSAIGFTTTAQLVLLSSKAGVDCKGISDPGPETGKRRYVWRVWPPNFRILRGP